jgi:hypothetical protein
VSKHTPGPWKVAPSWDDWTVVGPNKEEIIFQDGPYQTPTIRQPDAQLIAAAPELLEALIAITDYTFTASYCGALKNTACRCSTTCPIVAVIAKSRATIAKAIGETT